MSLGKRLTRLEARQTQGRCALCAARPEQVDLPRCTVLMPDNGRGDRAQEPPGDPNAGAPCAQCGWQPAVAWVARVRVYDRDTANT